MLHYSGILLRSLLAVSAGGAAVLGGSYLVSRYKDQQESEERLARLEELVEQLIELEKQSAKAEEAPKAKQSAEAKEAPKTGTRTKARKATSQTKAKSSEKPKDTK